MSATATVRRSSSRKSAAAAAPDTTAPDTTAPAAPESVAVVPAPAAPDTYPGALPPAEAPADPIANIPTTIPAEQAAALAAEANLQAALSGGEQAPPRIDADAVAALQVACYDRAIARAKTLALAENRTTVDIGGDLQEAIDAFKPLIPKKQWWRQRADTIDDFTRRYKLRMSGRDPRAYQAILAYHVHRLASDEAKAALIDGIDGRPFPIATLEAISKWVNYDRTNDTHTIKAGLEPHFDALIIAVADEGLTTADTEKRMSKVESDVRLKAAAQGGFKALKAEQAKQATASKKDRNAAMFKAVESFGKAIASDTIGGASAAEILNHLSASGLADLSGLIDPATITIPEAMAFADRLCELDRADIIHVMMKRFQTYATAATADTQAAKAPAPALDDSPDANTK